MSEGIIKSGRKQSFTVLYKSAIEDKRLPLDARGLLAITAPSPSMEQKQHYRLPPARFPCSALSM